MIAPNWITAAAKEDDSHRMFDDLLELGVTLAVMLWTNNVMSEQ